MRLEPKEEVTVDLARRFRDEAKALPARIALRGNAMQMEIARRLLERHAPHIAVGAAGEPVALMSLERYAGTFLASFLEGTQPPAGFVLLRSIPERELLAYARRNGIPLVEEGRDPVRATLDRIAQRQPQTYFSRAARSGCSRMAGSGDRAMPSLSSVCCSA